MKVLMSSLIRTGRDVQNGQAADHISWKQALTVRAAESFWDYISMIKGHFYLSHSILKVTAPPGSYCILLFTFPFLKSPLFFQPPSTIWKMLLLISPGAIFIEFLIIDVSMYTKENESWSELQLLFADWAACAGVSAPRSGTRAAVSGGHPTQ